MKLLDREEQLRNEERQCDQKTSRVDKILRHFQVGSQVEGARAHKITAADMYDIKMANISTLGNGKETNR